MKYPLLFLLLCTGISTQTNCADDSLRLLDLNTALDIYLSRLEKTEKTRKTGEIELMRREEQWGKLVGLLPRDLKLKYRAHVAIQDAAFPPRKEKPKDSTD